MVLLELFKEAGVLTHERAAGILRASPVAPGDAWPSPPTRFVFGILAGRGLFLRRSTAFQAVRTPLLKRLKHQRIA